VIGVASFVAENHLVVANYLPLKTSGLFPRVEFHHAVFFDVAIIPDPYRRDIPPDYDSRPNVMLLPDLHIADEIGRVSDKG